MNLTSLSFFLYLGPKTFKTCYWFLWHCKCDIFFSV